MDSGEIIAQIDEIKANLHESKLKYPKYRVKLLKKLKNNIILLKNEIFDALKKDLNKSETEAYMSEVGIVLSEISYMIKHCTKFAKPKRVKTPMAHFPSKSYTVACPYGVTLIISPWNYPFMLSIDPLVDAISAGNCVVLKSSETSKNTSAVIEKLINMTFAPNEVCFVRGGREECSFLLEQEYDHIFFTGSTRVGKIVLESASKHFTPVTLEMGGKSPCIVDDTANIPLSAKRIVFGKFLNAGQTCVAPDYVLCDERVKDSLVHELQRQIILQYGVCPLCNENYPKLINQRQFEASKSLITCENLIFGGKSNQESLKIEPTLIDAQFGDEPMKQEIFGPVLPIVTYKTIDEAIQKINSLSKPLAFYVFSTSHENQQKFISSCDFGGGCINDTIVHISNPNFGFGGLKESGMGAYHGKTGFDAFSHYKSILNKGNWLDLPMRYHPYTKTKYNLIKMFLK